MVVDDGFEGGAVFRERHGLRSRSLTYVGSRCAGLKSYTESIHCPKENTWDEEKCETCQTA
jgi:hypothetical protein